MRRDCSLVQLEDMLDRNLFIRISKSGIVNLMNVDSYKKGTININGSTLLLLMPLLGITIYKIGSPDVAQILDFFTFTLLSSIIINAVILVIRDMNKYKGISLRISVFYFFILIIESMFYSWSNNFILTVIIKYVISLCVSVFVLRMATKERIVMAYY